MEVGPGFLQAVVAVVSGSLPRPSLPAPTVARKLTPGGNSTCVATEVAPGSSAPICGKDDDMIRADCHPAGIAILQGDLE